MVIIKPDKDATYKNTVDMLDEMKIDEVKRYALVDITPTSTVIIQKTEAGERDKINGLGSYGNPWAGMNLSIVDRGPERAGSIQNKQTHYNGSQQNTKRRHPRHHFRGEE